MVIFKFLMVWVSLFLIFTSVGYADPSTPDGDFPVQFTMNYVSVLFFEEIIFTFYLIVISFLSTIFYDTIGPLNSFMAIYVFIFIIHVFKSIMSGNFGDFLSPLYKSGMDNVLTKTLMFYAILYTFLIPVEVEMWKLTPGTNQIVDSSSDTIAAKKLIYRKQKLEKKGEEYVLMNVKDIPLAITFNSVVADLNLNNLDQSDILKNKFPLITILPWSLYSNIVYGAPLLEKILDDTDALKGKNTFLTVLKGLNLSLYNRFIEFIYEPTSLIDTYLDFLPKLSDLSTKRASLVKTLNNEVSSYRSNMRSYRSGVSYKQSDPFYKDEELLYSVNKKIASNLNVQIKIFNEDKKLKNDSIMKELYVASVFHHYGLLNEYKKYSLESELPPVKSKPKISETDWLCQEIARNGFGLEDSKPQFQKEIIYITSMLKSEKFFKKVIPKLFSTELDKDTKEDDEQMEIQKRLTKLFLAKQIWDKSLFAYGGLIPVFNPVISSFVDAKNQRRFLDTMNFQGFTKNEKEHNPIYRIVEILKETNNDSQYDDSSKDSLKQMKEHYESLSLSIKQKEFKKLSTTSYKFKNEELFDKPNNPIKTHIDLLTNAIENGSPEVLNVLRDRANVLQYLQLYEESVNYMKVVQEVKRKILKNFMEQYVAPKNRKIYTTLDKDNYVFYNTIINKIALKIATAPKTTPGIDEYFKKYKNNKKASKDLYTTYKFNLRTFINSKSNTPPTLVIHEPKNTSSSGVPATSDTPLTFNKEDLITDINNNSKETDVKSILKGLVNSKFNKSTEIESLLKEKKSYKEEAEKLHTLNVGDFNSFITSWNSMIVQKNVYSLITLTIANYTLFHRHYVKKPAPITYYISNNTILPPNKYNKKSLDFFSVKEERWLGTENNSFKKLKEYLGIDPESNKYKLQDLIYMKANLYTGGIFTSIPTLKQAFDLRMMKKTNKLIRTMIDYSNASYDQYHNSASQHIRFESLEKWMVYESNLSGIGNLAKIVGIAKPGESSLLESPLLSAISKTLKWVYVPFIDGFYKFKTQKFTYTWQEISTVSGLLLYYSADWSLVGTPIKIAGFTTAVVGIDNSFGPKLVKNQNQTTEEEKSKVAQEKLEEAEVLDWKTELFSVEIINTLLLGIPSLLLSLMMIIAFSIAGLYILISILRVFIAYITKLFQLMANSIIFLISLPMKIIKFEPKLVSEVFQEFTETIIFRAIIVQSVFLLIIMVSIIAESTLDFVFEVYFMNLYITGEVPGMLVNFMVILILTTIMIIFINGMLAVINSKFFLDGSLEKVGGKNILDKTTKATKAVGAAAKSVAAVPEALDKKTGGYGKKAKEATISRLKKLGGNK